MNRLGYALMNLLFTPVDKNRDVLVCYASKTGTATHLAQQTAKVLRNSGRAAHVASLGILKPKDLSQYRQVLMIVSTCGEGEMPDDGKLFYEQLQNCEPFSVKTHVLALGDRSYRHYCSAGIDMHNALLKIGATLEPKATLVNGNPAVAWQAWVTQCTGTQMDSTAVTPLSRDVTLTLVERRELHSIQCTDDSNQAFHIEFKMSDDGHYLINELIGITPPNSDKERLYSIASSSYQKRGRIALTIARHQFLLEGKQTNGACSNYLIEELDVGDSINVTIKIGAGMPLPSETSPIILIATGAGIAPMISQLNERRYFNHTGDNWLIFGNRHQNADYYYQAELEEAFQNGNITHLDTAFSRDSANKVYVQDMLNKNLERLADWLLDRGAKIYVCGRPELKEEILRVIEQAIFSRISDKKQAQEKLCALKRNQQIYFELF